MKRNAWVTAIPAAVLAGAIVSCQTVDVAKQQGLSPADFPETAVDEFSAMDGGINLTADEIKGRNTWMLWTAGHQHYWDWLANHSFGTFDLLKILDSRNRNQRFKYYGLVNTPGFRQTEQPDEYGLWLDAPTTSASPAVDERVYGRATGIVGLRLFPNPAFDAEARRRWDGRRYYTDQKYYYDPQLVRPYLVGMTCAFCHVAPHPLHPPADPENPRWENLSSNLGNQYFWAGRVFAHDLEPTNFVWQLMNSSPPGALDTSFIATDNINNPRTVAQSPSV